MNKNHVISYLTTSAPKSALDALELIERRLREASEEVALNRARLESALEDKRYEDAAGYVEWSCHAVTANLLGNLRLDLAVKRAGELRSLNFLTALED